MLNGLKIAGQEGISGVRESGDKTLVLFGHDGIDGHASLSPEDLDGIAVLDPHANESNRVYNFTDEQNIPWKVSLVDYGVYRFEASGSQGLRGEISVDQLFPPSDSLANPDVAKLRDAGILSGVIPAESGTRHFDAAAKTAGPAEGDPDDWMTRAVRGPSKEDQIYRELEEEGRQDRELHEEEPGEIREERELLDMGTDHLARLGGYDTIMEEILENFPEEQVFSWLQKVKTTLPGHEASVKMAGSDYARKTELTTPDGYEIESYTPFGNPSEARRFTVWPPKDNRVGDYASLEEAKLAIEQWKQRGDPELLKRDGGANFKVDIPRDDLGTNTYTG